MAETTYGGGPNLDLYDAPTLTDIQVFQQQNFPKVVTETIISESSILQKIPFNGLDGELEYHIGLEHTLPTPQYRQLNDWITPSKATYVRRSFGAAFMAVEVAVDRAINRMKSRAGQLTEQLMKAEKALALKFENDFWLGQHSTATGLGFAGVDATIDAGFGGKVDIATAADNDSGVARTTAADKRYTFNDLDRAIDEMRHRKTMAQCIFMSRDTLRGFNNLSKYGHTGESFFDSDKDNFGNYFQMYNGIRIEIFGDNHLGNAIFPAKADKSEEVYVMTTGTENLSGLQSSMDIEIIPPSVITAGPIYVARVDWGVGVAIHSQHDVVKLTGGRPWYQTS